MCSPATCMGTRQSIVTTLARSKPNKGHTVNSGNFRDDLNLSGVVDKPDKQAVHANQGYSIPLRRLLNIATGSCPNRLPGGS